MLMSGSRLSLERMREQLDGPVPGDTDVLITHGPRYGAGGCTGRAKADRTWTPYGHFEKIEATGFIFGGS
jgi:hypothetical protein